MQLYNQTFPEGLAPSDIDDAPLVIIPGLFGSTSNWRSFAKRVSVKYPVVVIDQRNHGRSPHADSNNYFDLVADLLALLDRYGFDQVRLCGHSMGGKTAMAFSLIHPERVRQLAILDIAPVTYTHSHAPFLEELLKIDLSGLTSRSQADKALRVAIPDMATRLFLLQNLVGSSGSYSWRINLAVLHREMQTIVGFPIEKLAARHNSVKTLVMSGDKSNYVRPEHHEIINKLFPSAYFEGIANAGHWLHVEQPQAVIASLMNFLEKS